MCEKDGFISLYVTTGFGKSARFKRLPFMFDYLDHSQLMVCETDVDYFNPQC